ncbi:FAD-binding oxidoreductase [Scatolibacter rhodanostii]|uniref:FAD-binding oxidoreductase n=1 Tax=Scatolibacter rhodanostii TaxID=2014781 RepID=UPI000C0780E8|nr:FAD-binding oxidoreductase [Scatolibacter rhodanostii]
MNQCDYHLTGRVVIPADPSYPEARQGFNRAIQQYPLIIVYCQNEYDVSNAVIWARTYNIPLRIRNGGHNYEGYSNGNCTLVIDISEMNRISLDDNQNILHVQGGATNGQIYQFIAAEGCPFPGGTCPTVGISGYATGGGWGLSCRWLGLGCDSLEEIQLVNHESCILVANRSCNSNLFWALRGAGGGNFGVVVSMKFRLPPKVDFVTLIEIDYLHVTTAEQEVFLQTWQSWLSGADPRATLIARIYHSPEDGLAMLTRGIFYGTLQEAQVLMQPFLELPGARSRIESMTFAEAVNIIGSSYPPYEKFEAASRFAMREWTSSEISSLVELIQTPATGAVFTGLSLYSLGGKVSEMAQDETAFYWRNAHFIVWLETIWEDNSVQAENELWINERFPVLAAVTEGSYINFPYNKLPNYLEEYYGTHVCRLWATKECYDPYNSFSFPQGIWRTAQPAQVPKPIGDEYLEDTLSREANRALYRGFRYV